MAGNVLDIFNDDAFSVTSLTKIINEVPEGEYIPHLTDQLFAGNEEGVPNTTVMIDREGDSIMMIPDAPRGSPGVVTVGSSRDALPFKTHHLPTQAQIMADEVQSVRALGSERAVESLVAKVAARAKKMRKRLEATISFHRVGAITGKVFDSDGQRVLIDLFKRFDIEQQVQTMKLSVDGTDVRQGVVDAKRRSEDVIGNSGIISGWLGICGRKYFDGMVKHPKVVKAYDRWEQGSFNRDDVRNGFSFGNAVWKEFYGKIGNLMFIPEDEAFLIPLGSLDLFQTYFAPANYIETVNTDGLPFYAKTKILDYDVGVELQAQSNPLNICTKPRSIIRLKME